MASKLDGRIDALEVKLRQLKTQQQHIAARRRAHASRQSRRDDTRRKILVGAIVLAKVDQGVMKEELLRTWLDAALTRADDRELFHLPVGGG